MVGSNVITQRLLKLWIPLVLYAVFLLFPFAWMLIVSIKPDQILLDTRINPFAIISPTLENYRYLLQETEFPRWIWPRLGELGVLGPTVPEEDGGAGLGFLEHVVIVEEISRVSASIGMSYAAHSNLCVHNICSNGNEEQRARWLPKLLSGEHVGALAMSEAGAGSDVIGSMSCRAERVDGGWLANGSKMWITNGPEADVLVVYMRTAPAEDASSSVTAFVIERDMAGFGVSPKMDKLGMRGSPTSEIVFDDCLIPDDHVLGQPHQGVRVLMSGLDSERLVLSGGPIGWVVRPPVGMKAGPACAAPAQAIAATVIASSSGVPVLCVIMMSPRLRAP